MDILEFNKLKNKARAEGTLFSKDLLNGKGLYIALSDYEHQDQIRLLKQRVFNLKSTISYDFLEKNNQSIDKLVSGKRYQIKMFQARDIEVNFEDVFELFKKENSLFVGLQGLSALYLDQPDIFPNRLVITLDNKGIIDSNNENKLKIPVMHNEGDHHRNFILKNFPGFFNHDWVFVCFCVLD
jgi:hypothetical protein